MPTPRMTEAAGELAASAAITNCAQSSKTCKEAADMLARLILADEDSFLRGFLKTCLVFLSSESDQAAKEILIQRFTESRDEFKTDEKTE